MWLRSSGSLHQTALAMIAAKAGNRILVVGAEAADLAAELGRVVGLNGRVLVVDRDDATAPAVHAAADRAGALIEFTSTPEAVESDCDISVVTHLGTTAPDERARRLDSAVAALRPGGRVIAIDGTPKRLFRSGSKLLPADTILAELRHAGTRAARHLGTSEGVAYYEGLGSS